MSQTLVTEEFLDTYEGEVMFLSQDLDDLTEKLVATLFTQEEVELLSQNMLDVHDVFLSSTYTQHIAPIFKDFSEFIGSINLEKLLEHKEAQDYLCAIIVDVNTYIKQYFIDRIFTDVYLFQDSLQNSIDFLKSSYNTTEVSEETDDGSEVFFF